ncbi:uncharacterized protein LOC133375173 [Rhineura floridana]|uniref:uncharacterized protein LOC133375173 n=1 Tax=Rhineura floridana TaxID=261503 RepID=UPI002AC87343|nr:uncharacterized protein LOC133375173 [Rhineura floridana]
MSVEQSHQQQKQSSVLPPALSKVTSEPISEPLTLHGPDLEPEHQPPATKDPENLLRRDKEHHERNKPPSQPPTSDAEVEDKLESKRGPPSGEEEERPSQAEQQHKEGLDLPRALSQEFLKTGHPPPPKEAEGHLPTQPPPLVEQHKHQHQQKKQPPQWPPK